jgi:hypothetical protein
MTMGGYRVSTHDIIVQDGPGGQNINGLRGPRRNRGPRAGWAPLWLAALLAVLLLIGAGIAYRAAASGLRRIRDNPVALPVPLSAIPMHIGDWKGQNVSLPSTTEDYIRTNFADDYVSRLYVNTVEGIKADIYVVYCCTYPSGLLGHKPDVCYPSNGWTHDSTTPMEITSRLGQKIPCLMHEFHRTRPVYEQASVLSFYVLNGEITLREREFSGFFDRRPNISGNPARYVAQVQVSSGFDRAAQSAAADLVDTILTFLPDRHGRVKAASVPAASAESGRSR